MHVAMLKNKSVCSMEFQPSITEAGRCVACGLCLPHCPTYRKTLDEADSPRGRIMLMGAVLNGDLILDEKALPHIDLCLGCRACESVCPNKVAYGKLIDDVKVSVFPRNFSGRLSARVRQWLLGAMVVSPVGLNILGRLVRVWQRLGLRSVFRVSHALNLMRVAHLEKMLPEVPEQAGMKVVYTPERRLVGNVSLFQGCVARVLDRQTLNATVFLLNRLGYEVRIPREQTCCGALHGSMGDRSVVEGLVRRNVAAFHDAGDTEIIVTASGCAVSMREYSRLPVDGAVGMGERVRELGEFLVGVEEALVRELRPLDECIAVHEPCTLRNVQHGGAAAYRLLRLIPKLSVLELGGNDQCCGAAGAYHLDQPAMAAQLVADKVDAVRASGVRIIATSNFGCGLQIGAAARAAGLEVELVHPVVLLARQMGFADKT